MSDGWIVGTAVGVRLDHARAAVGPSVGDAEGIRVGISDGTSVCDGSKAQAS